MVASIDKIASPAQRVGYFAKDDCPPRIERLGRPGRGDAGPFGSHILAIVRRQLPLDWTARYHTTPVLIETFVDIPRHTRAVYRASGWTHVGATQGRGRYDINSRYDKPKKHNWPAHARTGTAFSAARIGWNPAPTGRVGECIAAPRPPQSRACAIDALGSSPDRFAQERSPCAWERD